MIPLARYALTISVGEARSGIWTGCERRRISVKRHAGAKPTQVRRVINRLGGEHARKNDIHHADQQAALEAPGERAALRPGQRQHKAKQTHNAARCADRGGVGQQRQARKVATKRRQHKDDRHVGAVERDLDDLAEHEQRNDVEYEGMTLPCSSVPVSRRHHSPAQMAGLTIPAAAIVECAGSSRKRSASSNCTSATVLMHQRSAQLQGARMRPSQAV